MGTITPKCAGCGRLMSPLDPKCQSCVNQSNYVVRNDQDLGIDREMKALRFNCSSLIPHTLINELMRDSVNYSKREEAKRLVNDYKNRPQIEKVIFNDPATIVYWRDGSKTVVKAENELFDPEKGLAMAIAKKALGNQGNYYEVFKKWLPEEKSVDNLLDKALGKPDTCANYDNECLPYGANKSCCYGKCSDCCPVDMNSKRYAGPTCREKCKNYKEHFGDVSK